MNHYSYYNKGHNLINSCYMQRKREMLAFYRVLLFCVPFISFFPQA